MGPLLGFGGENTKELKNLFAVIGIEHYSVLPGTIENY